MKSLFCTLLAAGFLSTSAAWAQTSTQTIKPTTRTEKKERRMEKMSDQEAREARKTRRIRKNNSTVTPANMQPNSPADVDLKNGGSDRTGSQPAR